MKAVVYQGFGSPDILRCEEIEKPTPKDDGILIKVRAASVNPIDWKLLKGAPYQVSMPLGLRKSKMKRPGMAVSPVVNTVSVKLRHLKGAEEVIGRCAASFRA